MSRTLLQNVTGIHPRPNPDSPTFLQSSCLSGKYWLIQEDEAGPLSQCVVTVIFRGAPSIIFMAILMCNKFVGNILFNTNVRTHIRSSQQFIVV